MRKDAAAADGGCWIYTPEHEKTTQYRNNANPADAAPMTHGRNLKFSRQLSAMVDFIIEHVRPVLLAQRDVFGLAPASNNLTGLSRLLLNRRGEPLDDDELRKWYELDWFTVTGLAVTPQDVRRSMCSHFYSRGVQALLGHEGRCFRYFLDHHEQTAQEYYNLLDDAELFGPLGFQELFKTGKLPAASTSSSSHSPSSGSSESSSDSPPRSKASLPTARTRLEQASFSLSLSHIFFSSDNFAFGGSLC
jgi:hypothetical protein